MAKNKNEISLGLILFIAMIALAFGIYGAFKPTYINYVGGTVFGPISVTNFNMTCIEYEQVPTLQYQYQCIASRITSDNIFYCDIGSMFAINNRISCIDSRISIEKPNCGEDFTPTNVTAVIVNTTGKCLNYKLGDK